MTSPVTAYGQSGKPTFAPLRTYFPPSPQPEPVSASMEHPTQGLGIFECPLPQASSNVQDLPPSPSDSWSQSPVMESQEFPTTSQQPPDLTSAAFDPFASYSMNTGMMTSASPEAPGLVFCTTPPSTTMPSHRNSISSACSPSDSYSQHSSEYYTPHVKMEDNHEWYQTPGSDAVLRRRLTTQSLTPYSTGVSPIQGPNEDPYKTAPILSAGFGNHFATPAPTDESRAASFDTAQVLPSVGRVTKRKRQRTTPEEATHECRVCGKLFKRSYNWKSHMETHNPERKYPHPCTAMVGSQPCSKKFQRKTDLDRHYDSVHRKLRNHQCNLCGNSFARRDTLRRHTEDGCTKRFELGFREPSIPPSTPAPQRWSSMPAFAPAKASAGMGAGPSPSAAYSGFANHAMPAPAIYAS